MGGSVDADVERAFVDRTRLCPGGSVLVGAFIACPSLNIVLHLAEVGRIVPPWWLNAMPRHHDHQNRDRTYCRAPPPAPCVICESNRNENRKAYAQAKNPAPGELHELHLRQDLPEDKREREHERAAATAQTSRAVQSSRCLSLHRPLIQPAAHTSTNSKTATHVIMRLNAS